MLSRKNLVLSLPLSLALLGAGFLTQSVQAFCGFYVAKADTKIFNKASQVAIVRDGDRTILTMSNDFQGEPKEFAIVIPVPTVLEKEQIHVGDRAVLEHLDSYTAPRLVEYFDQNPDKMENRYSSKCGLYEPGIGLENVTLSWGHDEYMYRVAKDYLPEEALYMIRYHSFYSGHSSTAYDFLMNDRDREMFQWVKKFNPYDLYSKHDTAPDVEALKPYYRRLIGEYFPPEISW